MARNKHPEITVELILNTAQWLFVEIGYEKTSMQNIMDETGLSKGAIYHHFKSKEEIFNVVAERIGEENVKRFEEIRLDPALSGKEKLEKLFRSSLLHPNQEKVLRMVPYLMDDPQISFGGDEGDYGIYGAGDHPAAAGGGHCGRFTADRGSGNDGGGSDGSAGYLGQPGGAAGDGGGNTQAVPDFRPPDEGNGTGHFR